MRSAIGCSSHHSQRQIQRSFQTAGMVCATRNAAMPCLRAQASQPLPRPPLRVRTSPCVMCTATSTSSFNVASPRLQHPSCSSADFLAQLPFFLAARPAFARPEGGPCVWPWPTMNARSHRAGGQLRARTKGSGVLSYGFVLRRTHYIYQDTSDPIRALRRRVSAN